MWCYHRSDASKSWGYSTERGTQVSWKHFSRVYVDNWKWTCNQQFARQINTHFQHQHVWNHSKITQLSILSLVYRKQLSQEIKQKLPGGMNSEMIHVNPLKINALLWEVRLLILSNIITAKITAGTSTRLVRMKFMYLLPTNSTELMEIP